MFNHARFKGPFIIEKRNPSKYDFPWSESDNVFRPEKPKREKPEWLKKDEEYSRRWNLAFPQVVGDQYDKDQPLK